MSAHITIDGNLTADPDFGVSTGGTSRAHLRVASHERIKRNGEWTSTDPEFFNVTLFGKPAEDAGDTLHKGGRVTVEGHPELELFDRRDGSTGAVVKVHARTARVSDVSSVVRENGRDIPVVDQPLSGPDRTSARAGVAPTPAPTQAATNGRSL
jgi:single-strand DNA-binding protein